MLPGFPEMSIILVLVLILFGAGKLPEVFASIGDGVKRFRSAQDEADATGTADADENPFTEQRDD
jgi:sec-independent protein translocase protein TatA